MGDDNSVYDRIGILVISHNRPKIDKAFCLMVDRICDTYPLKFLPLAVVSTEEEAKTFRDHCIEAHVHENKPVGRKHNFGMRQLRGRVKGVIHLGSDNIIDNNYIRQFFMHDEDLQWGQGLYIYNTLNGDTRFWDLPFRNISGPARYMSAKLLDAVGWAPWDDDINRGLDKSCHMHISPIEHTERCFNCEKKDAVLVDLKSRENINPYNIFAGSGKQSSAVRFLSHLSQAEADYIHSLRC